MNKIQSYFKNWPEGNIALNEKQLLALSVAAEINQKQIVSRDIMDSIISDRNHKDRKRFSKLNKERLFRYLLDIHDIISGDIDMSLAYAMFICSLSTSKKDVLLFHSFSVYSSYQKEVSLIDLDFWATKCFNKGLIESKKWNVLFKNQIEEMGTNKTSLLTNKKYWKEFHNSFSNFKEEVK